MGPTLDCIILAGGMGTRLRSVVADRPKPLALINGVPFLALPIHTLAASRLVRKAVIAVSYKAEAIIDYCRSNTSPLPIEFSYEKEPLGTGGGVKRALELTDSENVLILNGDSFLEFSLKGMHEQHLVDSVLATLLYTHVDDAARFGRLEIEKQKVVAFKEKTPSSPPGFINAGVYLFKRSIFENFSFPDEFSLERDLFPKLIPVGIGAFRAPGPFIDIGTPDSYLEAQTVLQPLVHNL